MYIRHSSCKQTLKSILFIVLFLSCVVLIIYLMYINQGLSLNYFEYPLDVDLYMIYENRLKTADKKASVEPINPIIFNTILRPVPSCKLANQFSVSPDLVILVKSALLHFKLRNNIRRSWGNPNCYRHHEVRTRTLFILGRLGSADWEHSNTQKLVLQEHLKYNDIVQFDFIEGYYNVTYKLIATLDFATSECSSSQFLTLIDDDFMLHPPNLMQTLRDVTKTQYFNYIAGDVLRIPRPVRFPLSKWYVSYSEYPYNLYPPFPTGGTIILSMPVAQLLSVGLRYTKLLPFEDVMIGIVLYKLGISPVHLDNVFAVHYTDSHIDDLISIHGFGDDSLFVSCWKKLNLQVICNS
uniref:Hexosyltransferase n=1 Tax=Schistosoma japonicum TaxID=6182 RepID=C1L3R2_SCHJA|nr:UDP-GlcNAc:betaGal beta-1,3-N-acetylglucosaminyltransferase 5 [Schistosoma japonicum]